MRLRVQSARKCSKTSTIIKEAMNQSQDYNEGDGGKGDTRTTSISEGRSMKSLTFEIRVLDSQGHSAANVTKQTGAEGAENKDLKCLRSVHYCKATPLFW